LPGGIRRKKLTDLGRAWAGAGRGGKNELESDLAVMGISLPAEQVDPEPIEIWAEHAEAFDVFCACGGQWRIVAGMAGAFYQGLDAAALAATMDMLGVEDRRRCLHQVQQIEAGALEVLNRK
jgi:hypothetical protein